MLLHVNPDTNCLPNRSGGPLVNKPNCCSLNCEGTHNVGCSILNPPNSFGVDFNNAYGSDGGAVFAMDWQNLSPQGDRNYLRFFFLPRAQFSSVIEASVTGPFGTRPQPGTWGAPCAVFDSRASGASCRLLNLQLIVNICLCGSWGGGGACRDNLHAATTDAYFEIGRVGVCPQVGTPG